MRLIAAALFAALMFATPAAAQKKCDIGSPKKPLIGTETFQVAGAGSNFGQFRDAYIKVHCTSAPFKWGLTDAKGKVLVPAQYYNVVPLSPTTAAVLPELQFKSDGNMLRYRLYVFGKGETKQILPWSRFGTYSWNGVRVPYAFSVGTGEIALIQGDVTKPLMIRNLGGKGWTQPNVDLFYQVNDTLIANFTAEDGTPVSRVLSLQGKPISPAIGAIERWETLTPQIGRDLDKWRNSSRYDYPVESVDYISTILTGDHAVLPYGKLYQPIGPSGEPLPMPPGVIGVFPLRVDVLDWAGSTTLGWALVEETPQGLRARPGMGTLQSVLARASSLPAFTGMARYVERNPTHTTHLYANVFAARQQGDPVWRIIDSQSFAPFGGDGATSSGANGQEAIANFIADRRAAIEKRTAQHERERAEAAARGRVADAALHDKLLSSGTICNWVPNIDMRGLQSINYMLANCKITTDIFFNYARGRGADPGLINQAEFTYWKDRGRYKTPIPAAPRDIYATPNWEAWGNSIIQSARESTDSFIRDNRRQYYSNMEKWNRGKQNWCC